MTAAGACSVTSFSADCTRSLWQQSGYECSLHVAISHCEPVWVHTLLSLTAGLPQPCLCCMQEKTVAHLINGASFGELALMQVGEWRLPSCLLAPHGRCALSRMRTRSGGMQALHRHCQASAREGSAALMITTGTDDVLHNISSVPGLLHRDQQQLKIREKEGPSSLRMRAAPPLSEENEPSSGPGLWHDQNGGCPGLGCGQHLAGASSHKVKCCAGLGDAARNLQVQPAQRAAGCEHR